MDNQYQTSCQSDQRRTSWPTLDLDYDPIFDQDFPLTDRITRQPAAYVLMKHLNQMSKKQLTDENNNENNIDLIDAFQLNSTVCDHPFQASSLRCRSNSVDLCHEFPAHCRNIAKSDQHNYISKSAQTLVLPAEPDLIPDHAVSYLNNLPNNQVQPAHPDEEDDEEEDLYEEINTIETNAEPNSGPPYAQGPDDHCLCYICLEPQWLHRRLCCGLPVCDECLVNYYEQKLQLGQFSMECINSLCHTPANRDEIRALLSPKSRDIYRALLLAHNDLGKLTRTCPQCNHLLKLKDSSELKSMRSQRNKDQTASQVTCEQCGHLWCFLCHAPWHQEITCKQFQEGDRLLRNWAKQINQGQVNAQKCPTCKTFIQRSSGCDHMHCRNCQTDFCYQCGEKLRHLKFFGNHYSKLSVFGCKYRYKAEQPVLRRTIRLSVFCAKLAAAPALCSAVIAAVGVAVAVGVVILPLYGLVRLCRWTVNKPQNKLDRRFVLRRNVGSTGGAKLLASARHLQRLTSAKTQAYPRLGRMTSSLDRPASLQDTSGLNDNAYDQLSFGKQFEHSKSVASGEEQKYFSFIDLSERPSNVDLSLDLKSSNNMFTMDFDSLDRLEHWSLNRTVYGLGPQSTTFKSADMISSTGRNHTSMSNMAGHDSPTRRSKSRSGRSIKKNFILTSMF